MRKEKIEDSKGILVYIECYGGNVASVSFELIGEALRLAEKSGAYVFAAAAGSELEQVKNELQDYPLEKVMLYETQDEYSPVLYEGIMVECIKELCPSVVLIGGTFEGRALAPRLAVAFETGLTADCTCLELDEKGNLIQTRPAFGGNVMASILTEKKRPQFATVRPKMMEPPLKIAGSCPEVRIKKVDNDDRQVRIVEVRAMEVADDITKSDLLVVAGRGVKKKEDLRMLVELAKLLGGRLACSRALVEKGWMTPKEQIGLSGNTVSPQYMITCGVSGTVQFMAGMKTTKNIIAINEDPLARIFEIAHFPVWGDLYEIVPKLICELTKEKE